MPPNRYVSVVLALAVVLGLTAIAAVGPVAGVGSAAGQPATETAEMVRSTVGGPDPPAAAEGSSPDTSANGSDVLDGHSDPFVRCTNGTSRSVLACGYQPGPTAVELPPQEVGDNGTVTVRAVNLSEGGFVAVHRRSFVDGNVTGSLLGVSPYLGAGLHKSVQIPLSLSEQGSSNRTLIAVVYRDDGDETFEFADSDGAVDRPYTNTYSESEGNVTDEAGDVIGDAATVTGLPSNDDGSQPSDATNESESRAPFTACTNGTSRSVIACGYQPGPTAVELSPQEVGDGGTVTVRAVNLSEGGFVAVHRRSFVDGKATESLLGVSPYLDAGLHKDVAVPLSLPTEGSPNRTLVAVVYRDDGDETFEFVDSSGVVDRPYTNTYSESEGNVTDEAGDVIGDVAVVIVPAGGMGGPNGGSDDGSDTESDDDSEPESDDDSEAGSDDDSEAGSDDGSDTESDGDSDTESTDGSDGGANDDSDGESTAVGDDDRETDSDQAQPSTPEPTATPVSTSTAESTTAVPSPATPASTSTTESTAGSSQFAVPGFTWVTALLALVLGALVALGLRRE
jgi:hypothetical protein